MKKIKFLTLAMFAVAFLNTASGQLSMAGFGVSQGFFQAKDVNISNKLTGGHAFIETPLAKCSFRIDFNYLTRLTSEKSNTSNIDNLFNLRLGYGKVFGEGQRLQVPVFGGASGYSTTGNLKLKSWGVGARVGLRFFVTEKVALHLDVNGDYIFAKKVKFTEIQGIERDVDINATHAQLNLGFMYMYNNKKQKN